MFALSAAASACASVVYATGGDADDPGASADASIEDQHRFQAGCVPKSPEDSARFPTACFDTQTRAEIMNKVHVDTPALHELFLIITTLTSEGRNPESRLVRTDTPYAARVREHFGVYFTHEVVGAVESLLAEGTPHHIAAKIDASAYRMRDDGTFEKRPEYTWIRGSEDNLEQLLPMLQDFSEDTDFKSFFRSRASQRLYNQQQDFFRQEAQTQQLLDWLNTEYPETKPFESVRLIVSPLAFAYQHQDGVVDRDFRQLIAHVNFPQRREIAKRLSPSAAAFERTSILFTELNHGFIEPSSPALLERIEKVFWGGNRFVDPEKVSPSYASGRRVFLEYLNWALISIYACEHYSSEDCQVIATSVASTMTDRRGFIDFAEFQDWLLRQRKKNPNVRLHTLTPSMVEWFELHAP
ncbi:MAG: hypothetical protein QNI87_11640 [Erythrobacter sp.]|uniref:hypothetical protein n=1 Tax=Erythrobacter sp. TaxID=1042 RepID=UPI002606D1CF|nr:hypothetical protein [Erythrobacter sp.]MDJ0979171.1 hypothetical protein [Erythrobacter sp.]